MKKPNELVIKLNKATSFGRYNYRFNSLQILKSNEITTAFLGAKKIFQQCCLKLPSTWKTMLKILLFCIFIKNIVNSFYFIQEFIILTTKFQAFTFVTSCLVSNIWSTETTTPTKAVTVLWHNFAWITENTITIYDTKIQPFFFFFFFLGKKPFSVKKKKLYLF